MELFGTDAFQQLTIVGKGYILRVTGVLLWWLFFQKQPPRSILQKAILQFICSVLVIQFLNSVCKKLIFSKVAGLHAANLEKS